jgi:hypothetical protein
MRFLVTLGFIDKICEAFFAQDLALELYALIDLGGVR